MQITPETANAIAKHSGGARFKQEDLADPQINIAYGAYYLRCCWTITAKRDARRGAYNAGIGERGPVGGAAGGPADFETAEHILSGDAGLRGKRAPPAQGLPRQLRRRPGPVGVSAGAPSLNSCPAVMRAGHVLRVRLGTCGPSSNSITGYLRCPDRRSSSSRLPGRVAVPSPAHSRSPARRGPSGPSSRGGRRA